MHVGFKVLNESLHDEMSRSLLVVLDLSDVLLIKKIVLLGKFTWMNKTN